MVCYSLALTDAPRKGGGVYSSDEGAGAADAQQAQEGQLERHLV